MASLVQELEQDAYNIAASLSNMLRKAKAVAVKLQLQQPMEWVEAELNGYKNGQVPDYRKLVGKARSRNPYHGWQPLMFGEADMERMVCEHPIRNSIREIEHLLETKGDISMALSGRQVEMLCGMARMPTLPVSVFFSRGSFVSILDAVRNKVLDWSLSLQAAGIKGEGMSFLPEEKAKVSGDKGYTYNIGSIGSFAGNLGGQVDRDVIAKSTQNTGQELETVAALVAQLRTYQGQMGLGAQHQAEVSRHVDALDEELRGGKPKLAVITALLKSIKSIAEGAAGNLVASGVVSAISSKLWEIS
jgi:hypothetical protein